MIEIGRFNTLKVIKRQERGVFLDGEELGDILLPKRYAPDDAQIGDQLRVFVYVDSEDRFIATTQKPRAQVGEFAYLKAVSVEYAGAFLDWGLPKDLLVPFREQFREMEAGRSYLVRVFLDEASDRIAASSKIDKFLDLHKPAYNPGQEVDLIIGEQTDLGYKAIVNHAHWGLLFANEVFKPLRKGQRLKGYIKQVRRDGKIDLSLYKAGYGKVSGLQEQILDRLNASGGYLPLSDKSSPEAIADAFGVSKKAYKQAIGGLFKQQRIVIEPAGIRLLD